MATLNQMADLVRESAIDTAIRREILDLARTTYATDYGDIVRGLATYFVRHFRLIDEADEMITAPGALVRAIQSSGFAWGDCDDAALLAGALLYSVGFGVRFRAVLPQPDGSFGHVWIEYKTPNAGELWRVFDPTVGFTPRLAPGEESLLVTV